MTTVVIIQNILAVKKKKKKKILNGMKMIRNQKLIDTIKYLQIFYLCGVFVK